MTPADSTQERLKALIEDIYTHREKLTDVNVIAGIENIIGLLDTGKVRVAERVEGIWTVNDWVKQAIVLYLLVSRSTSTECGPYRYFDKVPLKTNFSDLGVRMVPPAAARFGSSIGRQTVLMPCHVNIGAHIGERTLIDTWASIGPCAQIGSDVHISTGAVIGGALEPIRAMPAIIEDGAFIGARASVLDGILVEEEAVIGPGVTLTASTPILDVTGREERTLKGKVPARSVVVASTTRQRFKSGDYELPAALIIGKRTDQAAPNTILGEILRSVLQEYNTTA